MEAGVAGVPDETKGEVAHAWVVLKAGHTATAEELRMYCREQLAPYKVPARIEFRFGAAEDDGWEGSAPGAGGRETPVICRVQKDPAYPI